MSERVSDGFLAGGLRCETCKFWGATDGFGNDGRGDRNNCGGVPGIGWAPKGSKAVVVGELETARDFGCVMWEAKP